jgi:hypothetical protein
MAAASPHIQFRARPPLADELRARVDDPEDGGSLSHVAGESARQLFRLYAAELRDMELSRDDCVIITSALWSTLVDSSWLERAPLILSAEIEESDEDDFDEAAHAELANRIRAWTRVQALAVIDAVERFKRLPTGTVFDEAMVQVGLLPPPRPEK